MELAAIVAAAVAAVGAVGAATAAWLSALTLRRNAEAERVERQFQRVYDALVELLLTAKRASQGVLPAMSEVEPRARAVYAALAVAPVKLDQCELMARSVPRFEDVVNQSQAAFEELAREWLQATGRTPPPGPLVQ